MGNAPFKEGFAYHCNNIVNDGVYIWGGKRHDLPPVHDSPEKRQITSSIDHYDVLNSTFVKRQTTGTPPNGTIGYASCCIGDDIYYFGGSCDVDDCFHNDLFVLNTGSYEWREIICDNDGPMRKRGCGMIPFTINGEDYLLIIGGYGPLPSNPSSHAQYTPILINSSRCYTNEVHIMCVSTTPGKWIVPTQTVGSDVHEFPSSAYFSINTLPGNRAISFGGLISGLSLARQNLFIMSYTRNTVQFSRLVKPFIFQLRSMERCNHSSAVISSVSDSAIERHYLVVLGGCGTDGVDPISDFWILDIEKESWKQIDLPISAVIQRYGHSMSYIQWSGNCVWLLISGGRRTRDSLITDTNVVAMVELVFSPTDNNWIVTNVLNEKDMQNSTKYANLMIERLSNQDNAHKQEKTVPTHVDEPTPVVTSTGGAQQLKTTQQITNDKQIVKLFTKSRQKHRDEVALLQRTAEEKIQQYQELEEAMEDLRRQIQEKEGVIHQLNKVVKQKNEEIKRKEENIQESEKVIVEQDKMLEDSDETIRLKNEQLQEWEENAGTLLQAIQENECHRHEGEKSSLRRELEETRERLQEFEEKVMEMESEKEKLEAEKEQLEATNQQQQELVQEKDQLLIANRKKLKEVEEKIQEGKELALAQIIEQKEELIQQLNEELRIAKQTAETAENNLLMKLEYVRQKDEKFMKRIQGLSDELSEKSEEVIELQQRRDDMALELEKAVYDGSKTAEETILRMKEDVREKDNTIRDFQEKLEANEKRIEELGEIADVKSREVQTMAGKIEAKDEVITKLEKTNEEMNKIIQEMSGRIQNMSTSIQAKKVEIHEAKKETSDKNKLVDRLMITIEERDEVIQKMRREAMKDKALIRHLEETSNRTDEGTCNEEMQETIKKQEKLIDELNQSMAVKIEALAQNEESIQQVNRALQLKEEILEQKNSQIRQNEESLQRKDEIIQQKQRIISNLESQLQRRPWILEREEVELTDQRIGGGAYGEVKVAIFRGTKVAAKLLHELIVSRHNKDIFTREMEISSGIHHPNIVQFVGATRVDNPILLYELMATTLHKRLQNDESLTRPQIISIASDICTAMCYLHQSKPQPIIHRDISSPNVLMEPLPNDKWRAKLSDFGSANLQLRTKTIMAGNPTYAAPEAIIPRDHTPAMDVYSFGVLLTEMTQHRAPVMDSSEREIMAHSIEWIEMKGIVLQCINDDRSQRLTSEQLLIHLQTLASD